MWFTSLCLACLLVADLCQAEVYFPQEQIDRIAFGSCNKTRNSQLYWDTVAEEKPDLWLWLGDNIYADTRNMHLLEIKYRKQKNNPHYQRFIEQVPVIGIWDDHDYGENDANRLYPKKAESKELFMDFMDIPENYPIHQRDGIYQSYVFGASGRQLRFILLDTRSFQDPLEKRRWGAETTYHAATDGQILGDAQWQWLQQQLLESDADVNIIASSLQVIAEDHRYEMWKNFPEERHRLFDLVVDSGVRNPVFLSGDRHISEISQLEWRGKVLYDITSSGLTHAFLLYQEHNRHRQGPLVNHRNFAVMDFDWVEQAIEVRFISPMGKLHYQQRINLH